jgi:arylsulfatase
MAFGGCREVDRPTPPDVVLFVVDTLRRDYLSCYGYPAPTSPRIDAFAAQGALFEDPTSQCSWTKPSMVSLVTGRYVTSYRDFVFEDAPTLAEVFKDAGYRTAAVVANTLLDEEAGFTRGFDWYDLSNKPNPELPGKRLARDLEDLEEALWPILDGALAGGEGGERPPLFLVIHAMEPHFPYDLRPEYEAELPLEAATPLRPAQREDFLANGPEAPVEDPGWVQGFDRLRNERGRYARDIREADRLLGRLVDRLAVRGVGENALFALVSDHGETLFEERTPLPAADRAGLPPYRYFYREHGVYLREGLINTPFILWGAGVPAGLRVAEPVENVDLFPTLLDLAGLQRPAGLHGQSQAPRLLGQPSQEREFVFSAVFQHRAVREVATGLKLVIPTEAGRASGFGPALYHLGSDPQELVNLLSERPQDGKRLAEALDTWIRRYPTPSTLGRELSASERSALDAMGYAGEGGQAKPEEPAKPEGD